ncbi:MAG: N-(5'-phosphoribosyl)anthranilate isomerase [Alphaproteobacteria bacterium RIFCSPHIGHO2_12_FULL_45_9]|nr:MAG: N-(5'-phosphoribosyl)anthranilate isomerase [Alphaproteobacteria bacterium RIFCSPHIGHO2_02_FULL_46_13]OFW96521.1 MAG: N-(5'-phosphoribosyl)anthranilate isomerase [Alphaproteobacteria bacterium RIFCSPHIGHO2_12_FULL_45_9]
MTSIKICGIKTPEILSVAASAGARFAGFVFVPQSPRYIHPEQARLLSRQLPTGLRSVGLFVDPSDEDLGHILGAVSLDFIQLHGNESPARVQAIKSRFNIPVIKAFAISAANDLDQVAAYIPVIDWILFDAKAPASSNIAGGNGVAFDWAILKDKNFAKPWMLSGGLTPENVADALSILSPDAVDVSSGVESSRGVKDAQKVRDFIAAVKT